MAFNIYGSVNRGAHSDNHANDTRKRRIYLEAEIAIEHGPVKVLMENGERLKVPKVIPLHQTATA